MSVRLHYWAQGELVYHKWVHFMFLRIERSLSYLTRGLSSLQVYGYQAVGVHFVLKMYTVGDSRPYVHIFQVWNIPLRLCCRYCGHFSECMLLEGCTVPHTVGKLSERDSSPRDMRTLNMACLAITCRRSMAMVSANTTAIYRVSSIGR